MSSISMNSFVFQHQNQSIVVLVPTYATQAVSHEWPELDNTAYLGEAT